MFIGWQQKFNLVITHTLTPKKMEITSNFLFFFNSSMLPWMKTKLSNLINFPDLRKNLSVEYSIDFFESTSKTKFKFSGKNANR